MRKLVKDTNGTVMELVSPNGFIPDGFELVPELEIDSEELTLARRKKLDEIRAERNTRLLANDKAWLIASKTAQDKTSIETLAQTLRDLPEAAETALGALNDVEAIKAYNAFAGL